MIRDSTKPQHLEEQRKKKKRRKKRWRYRWPNMAIGYDTENTIRAWPDTVSIVLVPAQHGYSVVNGWNPARYD